MKTEFIVIDEKTGEIFNSDITTGAYCSGGMVINMEGKLFEITMADPESINGWKLEPADPKYRVLMCYEDIREGDLYKSCDLESSNYVLHEVIWDTRHGFRFKQLHKNSIRPITYGKKFMLNLGNRYTHPELIVKAVDNEN